MRVKICGITRLEDALLAEALGAFALGFVLVPGSRRRIAPEAARAIGEALGLRLEPGRVGGGSDGNFTAALGVPTLDGLGLFGGDAHQKTEYVVVPEIPRRTALLAELLAAL